MLSCGRLAGRRRIRSLGSAAVPELLAAYTTLRLGGPARAHDRATTEAAIVEAVGAAGTKRLFILGRGSNVVVADEGFDGTVVHVASCGVELSDTNSGVRMTVQAGEDWDGLVARAVADGLAGIECLSGIPGTVGAAPIQNIGAYGQEVADAITGVRVLDRFRRTIVEIPAPHCLFGYRTSRFKRDPARFVVLAVHFALNRSGCSRPIQHVELARALDVSLGAVAPLAEVRDAVPDCVARKEW